MVAIAAHPDAEAGMTARCAAVSAEAAEAWSCWRRTRDMGPTSALWGAWRFSESQPQVEAILCALEESPPRTDGARPEAWAVAMLAAVGERIRDREQASAPGCVPRPDRDAAARSMWEHFFGGDPWSARELFDAVYASEAARSFAGALVAQRVPAEARAVYLRDLDEAFFFALLGGGSAAPGWLEWAARTVETGDGGPFDALARSGGAAVWHRVARCPTTRSATWRAAVDAAWPDLPSVGACWTAFAREAIDRPQAAEALLDFKVALRLVMRWSSGEAVGPASAWRTVLRHRNRTRGRLRAAFLDVGTSDLHRALQALDALDARTRAGIRGYAWSWACRTLDQHQLPSWEVPLTAPCPPPLEELAALSPSDTAALRTWVTLVALRGRFDQLRHWVRTGQWLRRPDSGWGRLLKTQLPGALRDVDGGYERVRQALALDWSSHLAALVPRWSELSGCSVATRPCKRAFRDALAEAWDPHVVLPKRIESDAVDHLRRAVAAVCLATGDRPRGEA